jgi:hypothetical protein
MRLDLVEHDVFVLATNLAIFAHAGRPDRSGNRLRGLPLASRGDVVTVDHEHSVEVTDPHGVRRGINILARSADDASFALPRSSASPAVGRMATISPN